MTRCDNMAFQDGLYIRHPLFGIGIIHRIVERNPAVKGWVEFGNFRLFFVPARFPRKKWIDPERPNSTLTLVEIGLKDCYLVPFGVDSGALVDKDSLLKSPEYSVYAMIHNLTRYICTTIDGLEEGSIALSEEILNKLDEAEKGVSFATAQTARFGTGVVVPKPGVHLGPSEACDKWFSWWDRYVQYQLSPAQHRALEEAAAAGEDIFRFRPSGHWRDVVL